MFVVAAIKKNGLLGRTIAPVRRRVIQGRITWPGCLVAGGDFQRVGDDLGSLVKERESEPGARRE